MDCRSLLVMQRSSLVEGMRPASEDWAKVRAREMIARIDRRLLWSDTALEATHGLYSDNGWAPQVENIVLDLEYRPSPGLRAACGLVHLGEPVSPVRRVDETDTQNRKAA